MTLLACSLSLFNISLLILWFNWWFIHQICGSRVTEETLCFTWAALATQALLCINISIVFSLVFSTAHQILMIQNDLDGSGIGFSLNLIIYSILLLYMADPNLKAFKIIYMSLSWLILMISCMWMCYYIILCKRIVWWLI